MRRKVLPDPEEICGGATRIAVLEDIMNQTNVGAIFRSAAALGFDGILLTKGCSDPLYRRSVRVSMGTVFQIPWTYFDSSDSGYVKRLKEMGFATAAMALRDDTVGIDDTELMGEERLALIFGTEGEGLKDSTIEDCDYTVKIPMAHGVDSLNVAASSAVAFWQLGKFRQKK
jgi:tRNA G18 (ribose-2'-O)-methylase SpoU